MGLYNYNKWGSGHPDKNIRKAYYVLQAFNSHTLKTHKGHDGHAFISCNNVLIDALPFSTTYMLILDEFRFFRDKNQIHSYTISFTDRENLFKRLKNLFWNYTIDRALFRLA